MSKAKAEQQVARELTTRQREWLAHLKRCEASGETKRAYAKRHRLSIQAMYYAAKDLRRRGALPPAGRAARTVSFVRVSTPPSDPGIWRVRFASGAVLEASSPLSGESLTTLVEALSASR
jgi:hypothetical protein